MKTVLLPNTQPARFDKKVIGNILLEPADEAAVRGEKMLIGLRNEDGVVYRLIGAAKASSFMNAVEELMELGLTDELAEADGPRDGFDAVFVPPRR